MSFPWASKWKIFPTGFLTAVKGFKYFFNFVLQYFHHSGGIKHKQWQQKELILKNEISKIGELLTTINIWFLVWTVNEDWENTKINNRSVDKKTLPKNTIQSLFMQGWSPPPATQSRVSLVFAILPTRRQSHWSGFIQHQYRSTC